MSLPSEQSSVEYTGNNSTSTPYPISFNFFVASDIVVVVTGSDGESSTLIPVTDYTVTGGDAEAGATGSLTTTAAIPVSSAVLIERTVPLTQETAFTGIGKFPSASVDHALDKLTMGLQQIQREIETTDGNETTIKLRRDTPANWNSDNPVLSQGEVGVELAYDPTTPNIFKIGDGLTAWNDLLYSYQFLGFPASSSVIRFNSDGTTEFLDSSALANFLGVTTDNALNSFAEDPTSNENFSKTTWRRNLSKTVVYASDVATLDSNVQTGGGTDVTSALQAVLNEAIGGTEAVELIMDGAALVTGLHIYSNSTIRCLSKSCGFFLKNASNRPVLRNGNPTSGAIVDTNIKLIGGVYNGNRDNQNGNPAGGENDNFLQGIAFYGVTGLSAEDVTIRNAFAFSVMVTNASNVYFNRSSVEQSAPGTTDGIHICPNVSYLTITNCTFTSTGSNPIAINSADYHDQTPGTATWVTRSGTINHVWIENITLINTFNGIGIISGDGISEDITIKGVFGSTHTEVIALWNPWSTAFQSGYIGRVSLSNINATCTSGNVIRIFSEKGDNPGGTEGANNIRNIQINDSQWTVATTNEDWMFSDTKAVIDVLSVNGVTVEEPTENTNGHSFYNGSSAVNLLSISNFIWKRPAAVFARNFVFTNSGTVETFVQSNVVTNNLSGIVTGAGTITTKLESVSGPRDYNVPYPLTITADQTAVANTTTETNLLNSDYVFPLAETWIPIGRTMYFKATGLFSTSGTPTLRLRFKINGQVPCDTLDISMPSSVTNLPWIFEGCVTFQNIGGGGLARGVGNFSYSGSTNIITVSTGVVAVNSAIDASVQFSARWGTANPANTIIITQAPVRLE